MTIDEILTDIVRICRVHQVEEVILFGSRAKGCALEKSDIDVAVRGAADFQGLSDAIEELPTLYTIDIVNLDEAVNQLFLEDIITYGRTIYKKI